VDGVLQFSLVKSFDWKRFLAVYSQVPVGKQIFLMNFDLCYDQLVFVRRQFTSQNRSVKN